MWTVKEKDVKMLEAIETWTWRQVEDMSWKSK